MLRRSLESAWSRWGQNWLTFSHRPEHRHWGSTGAGHHYDYGKCGSQPSGP